MLMKITTVVDPLSAAYWTGLPLRSVRLKSLTGAPRRNSCAQAAAANTQSDANNFFIYFSCRLLQLQVERGLLAGIERTERLVGTGSAAEFRVQQIVYVRT